MLLCIAGKNSISVEILDFASTLLEKNEILGIPSEADTGKDGWQPSFLKKCRDEGIKCVPLQYLYNLDVVFLSLEFDKIIAPEKFKSKFLYNIHFSKLPKYRGMYTSVWPILNGENESGVTLHVIDKGIDSGDIIDQMSFPIDKEDTSRDLYFKYLKHGTMLVKANLQNILDHNIVSNPQPKEGASYYSKASIDFSNIKLDFNQSAENISQQIRAFCFKEYQMPKLNGRAIKEAKILAQPSTKKPLSITEETQEHCVISSMDYDVKIIWE